MKTFLSSTYVDLVSYRQAAAEAVERLGQQAGRMEVFGARPRESLEACLSEINECDLFVGIYAHRYGFVPDGSDVSITEAEFDYAKKNDIALFCFLVHEDHPWPPKLVDGEFGRCKLHSFKQKICTSVIHATFTTPEDLAYKIATSLGRYLSTIYCTKSEQQYIPDLSPGHTEFFAKILSEISTLRVELQYQKELLQKVNHISELLRPSDLYNPGIQPMTKKLPLDFRGCWKDSLTGSTFYPRYLGEELIVPYCFGGASQLTGVIFDFQRTTEGVVFARFKWFDVLIQGFTYMERSGSNKATGGWWYSEDVPRQTLEDLQKLGQKPPRMNDLSLSKMRGQRKTPQWVNDFFSMPRLELLNRLRTDALSGNKLDRDSR